MQLLLCRKRIQGRSRGIAPLQWGKLTPSGLDAVAPRSNRGLCSGLGL